jgi:hypothetical protein
MTAFVTRHYDDPPALRDHSARKRMPHRALACFGRLVPRLPERGVRADGISVAMRYQTIDHRGNDGRQDGPNYGTRGALDWAAGYVG